jgi:nucleoside-triphosphatase THEP1
MNASSAKFKIILITGNPGVGKTTLIKKLYDKLTQDASYKSLLTGFYTEEVRNSSNERIGFDIIDLNDETKRTQLARSMYCFFLNKI